MKKLMLTVFSGLLFSSIVPTSVEATSAIWMKKALQAGLPASPAGIEIVQKSLVNEYNQVKSTMSPEDFIGAKNRGLSVQQMIAEKKPQQQQSSDKQQQEIEMLKKQLALLEAQKGLSHVDTEEQRKVTEETNQLVEAIEKTPAKVGDPDFVEKSRDLLEKIEKTSNVAAMVKFYEEIMKRLATVDQAKDPLVWKNLDVLASELEKNDYAKEVVEKAKIAEENMAIAKMASDGAPAIAIVTQKVNADNNYLKTSPLTVILFLTKTELRRDLVRKNIATLGTLAKKASLEDLQAIYSYLHSQGIAPNDKTRTPVTEFMRGIGELIATNAGGAGLSGADFNTQFKLGSANRTALTAILNNMVDPAMKAKLLNVIAVGGTIEPPVLTADEIKGYKMTGKVGNPAIIGGGASVTVGAQAAGENPAEIANKVVIILAPDANLKGNTLSKNDKVTFTHIKKSGSPARWFVIGDVDITEKAVVTPSTPSVVTPPVVTPSVVTPPTGPGAVVVTLGEGPLVDTTVGTDINIGGMVGFVTSVAGGGTVTFSNSNPAKFTARVDAGANILGGKGPLQKGDKIQFDHVRKSGIFWVIEGDITVTSR